MRNLDTVIFTSLICVILQGCVQMLTYAQPADCRGCHVTNLAPGARDFSAIYADPSTHHPTDISYPQHESNFNPPTQQRGKVSFFDNNGNGQPDNDEITLFEKSGMLKVECASCHKPHGLAVVDDSLAGRQLSTHDFYLRTTQTHGDLCSTCHKK